MYAKADITVRSDLERAHARAWRRLGEPGTWLDGRTRIEIAAELRHAVDCELCKARTEALSASVVSGAHRSLNKLAPAHIEIVHRLRHDAARITQQWVEDIAVAGIGEGEYVETLAVAATVLAVDGFTDALGWPRHALPEPSGGEPPRARPANARLDIAWVATLPPGEQREDEVDPYRDTSGVHIHQALSLVPTETIAFFELDAAQYLPDSALRDYGTEYRALTHVQIEYLAARVSAINQCVY